MGDDLHITRAELWADNAATPITAAEWHAYVAADPELTLDPRNGPHMVLWTGPSVHVEPWLDWSDGDIYTKYPDRALVAKMLQVADHFGARVQGDDGENYCDPDQVSDDEFHINPTQVTGDGPAPTRRSWWRRLLGCGPALIR